LNTPRECSTTILKPPHFSLYGKALPEHLDAGYPADLRELLGRELLRIGAGQHCGHGFFIGHGIDPRPVCLVGRKFVTRVADDLGITATLSYWVTWQLRLVFRRNTGRQIA
jgi:hypothetical protein